MRQKILAALVTLLLSAAVARAQNDHLFYNTTHNRDSKSDIARVLQVKERQVKTRRVNRRPDFSMQPADYPPYLNPLRKWVIREEDTEDDSTKIRIVRDLMDSIRRNYTVDYLSATRFRIRPFSLIDLHMYNMQTINNYLYSQGGIATFRSVGYQYAGNATGYLTAEFVSLLLGPVRMGVSGAFKVAGDTTASAAQADLQKILSGSSTVNVDFAMPLLFMRERTEQVHFGIFAQTAFQFNPATSGHTEVSSNMLFCNQSGLLFHFDAGSAPSATADQVARFFVDVPVSYVCGSTVTYSQLSVTDFSVVQLRAGIVIRDMLSFGISGPLYSTSATVQHLPFLFSVNLSPAEIVRSIPN